jgi:DNA polymerase elongation subunit (family B)
MSFYTSFFPRGDSIYYRGYKDGKRVQLKHKYHPYLFVGPYPDGNYKTIDGKAAFRKTFPSISEAKEFIEKYQDVGGLNLYGLSNFEYVFIRDAFPGEIKSDPSLVRVGILDIEVAADDGFPDIEAADKPITAISLKYNVTGDVYVFGCGDFETTRPDVIYYKFSDEVELLKWFLIAWENLDLDIVTGWNVRFFDIPYLVHRIALLGQQSAGTDSLKLVPERLSPWKYVYRKEIEVRGKVNVAYDLQGISVLDYLELFRKFTFTNHESYRLDYISQVELGERKLDYSEYGSLLALYRNNYQKFIEYNIRDVELVEKLDKKHSFIELVQELAYDAKCNYIDVLTTIRPWDVIIHNYLIEQKIVIPFFKQHHANGYITGGYVKEPRKGMSNWVVSFDLTSLYPHLMMGWNISPDTYLGQIEGLPFIGGVPQAYRLTPDKKLLPNFDWTRLADGERCTVAANGCKYRTDFQGFMPALMEAKFKDRDIYKKAMLEWKQKVEKLKQDGAPEEEIAAASKEVSRFKNKQQAKKIQLNSLYGALLNLYNRWYSYNNGEAVTTTGQLVIRFVEMVLNVHLNQLMMTEDVDYVIASDTDSVYICLDKFADTLYQLDAVTPATEAQICDAIDNYSSRIIQPYLEKAFKEFCLITHAYQEKLFMKREIISTKGLWRAKKMYILNVLNDEGVQYDTPKLKMMGIETVRSSTPLACRNAIKEAISIIMNKTEDDLIEYVREFKKTFYKLPFEDIASPRSVSKLEEYSSLKTLYIKRTPVQVKSALLYNYMIDKHKLKNLEPVRNGDKIKFCYLKDPNPLYDTCIGSPGVLPPEFGLEKYLDREKQFEKAFLAPIKSLTESIDWEVERIARLF